MAADASRTSGRSRASGTSGTSGASRVSGAASRGGARRTDSKRTPIRLDGSLAPLLPLLDGDAAYSSLVSGAAHSLKQGVSDGDSIVVDAPEGMRPAIAAARATSGQVVFVVPSGRDAEDAAGAIRSWYDGNPRDVAVLDAWETLPHERLSPRADTVAQRMAVFYRLAHPQAGDTLFTPIRILVMPVRSLIQPIVAGIEDV